MSSQQVDQSPATGSSAPPTVGSPSGPNRATRPSPAAWSAPRRAERVAGAEPHGGVGGDREPPPAPGDVADPAPVDEAELADEVVGDLDPRETGASGDEEDRRPRLVAVNAFLVDGDIVIAHTDSRVATLKSVAVARGTDGSSGTPLM